MIGLGKLGGYMATYAKALRMLSIKHNRSGAVASPPVALACDVMRTEGDSHGRVKGV